MPLRQFYKIVTKPLPALAQQLIKDFAGFAITLEDDKERPSDVLGTYPVDEHTLMHIMIDYRVIYTKQFVPEQPLEIFAQSDIAAVMMVNPFLTVDLGDAFYAHTIDGTFSTVGMFGDEPARFILSENEEVAFEFYRQLNLGLIQPSQRPTRPGKPPAPLG